MVLQPLIEYMQTIPRFWLPREEHPRFDSETSAYFYSPENDSVYGRSVYKETPKTLEQLRDIPCLVLLGESGMGKSFEIDKEIRALNAIKTSSQVILKLPLGLHRSELALAESIKNDWQILDWCKSADSDQPKSLFLFLDAYDEGLLGVQNLSQKLRHWLENWPLEFLRLRITSRSSQWSESLEQFLRNSYAQPTTDAIDEGNQRSNSERFGVYQLMPFRRKDVLDIATSHESWKVTCPNDFMQAVSSHKLDSIAARPKSLRFLLKVFREESRFEGSRVQLLERGYAEICKEQNDDRNESGISTLSGAERLAIVTRIAALTLFTNKSSVWMGRESDEAAKNDLILSDVCGQSEPVSLNGKSSTTVVDDARIREALDTSLFMGQEGARRTWVLRSDEEFLAARFLTVRLVPQRTLCNLLCAPLNGNLGTRSGRVYPAMKGVATHLISWNTEFLRYLINYDIDTLLDGDLSLVEDDDKRLIVKAIVEKLSLGELDATILRGRVRPLTYPNIANDIRPYLADTRSIFNLKLGAVFLSEACCLTSMGKNLDDGIETSLVEITLDHDCDERVRFNSAVILMDYGGENTKKRLIPLVAKEAECKIDFELKGIALKCVWPDHLTSNALFSALQNSCGYQYTMYESFMTTDIVSGLREDDVVAALEYVRTNVPLYHNSLALRNLCNRIVLFSWDWVHKPEVARALARVVQACNLDSESLAGVIILDKNGRPRPSYFAF
jgi:hypothetical protein